MRKTTLYIAKEFNCFIHVSDCIFVHKYDHIFKTVMNCTDGHFYIECFPEKPRTVSE